MEHKNQTKASANEFNLCHGRLSQEELDEIWAGVHEAAEKIIQSEPQLRHLLTDVVISRKCMARGLAARLARKLAREDMQRDELEPLLCDILINNGALVRSAARDMQAIVDRDPACQSALEPLLFYKGFLAITSYRISHHLWGTGRHALALYFQSISSEIFGVDIHPAARIGCGILLDHATSVVVGETSIIEDDVSILHEVTLGGTGKVSGDRHPIVRSGVLIGAGSKILGRVTIGTCAKVGAGSVVLEDVPPHKTVAGVPAVVMGESNEENPALGMNQSLCDGNRI
ncbi:serine O-acetyltransferase [Verrucomicrobiaceae bacterium R5-34]|uniref:Serine acetyltransferase n=1 Tax=Oceaniferula flava TaxID=2800421 RepID=A0AAE2SCP3_9BACT|nr:serine O-acetyltransferase [Oceaniferula flavus]MBK1829661.1 serine O-acetyltransferase [Verrucomicrobiaceae bacterium R5-34]MBK1853851.1 serine O-acetyltransferase [Oceaniferula flavus]MBM1135157.1 serine O-acetyltransferase [Oceaniferula flavus]